MSISFTKDDISKIKGFLVAHGLVFVVASLMGFFMLSRAGFVSLMYGQLVMVLSLSSISVAVYLGAIRKNIVLLVSVIVLKWPILLYVLFKMFEKKQEQVEFFVLGMSLVFVSSGFWYLTNKQRR